jgi:hypothetical protein
MAPPVNVFVYMAPGGREYFAADVVDHDLRVERPGKLWNKRIKAREGELKFSRSESRATRLKNDLPKVT